MSTKFAFLDHSEHFTIISGIHKGVSALSSSCWNTIVNKWATGQNVQIQLSYHVSFTRNRYSVPNIGFNPLTARCFQSQHIPKFYLGWKYTFHTAFIRLAVKKCSDALLSNVICGLSFSRFLAVLIRLARGSKASLPNSFRRLALLFCRLPVFLFFLPELWVWYPCQETSGLSYVELGKFLILCIISSDVLHHIPLSSLFLGRVFGVFICDDKARYPLSSAVLLLPWAALRWNFF